ncbi:MAG TPA: hypothetical protein VHZ26_18815 [Caulobacteraceae bacterium]|jgi:hypothetical protein|nr:hypothetical protein [Caulobacteraceae bacterium]
MTSIAPIRSALIAGLVFCGVGLASCSEPAPPPPPPPLAPPPTPAAFELSPAVIGAAAAYEDYMARASLVDPNFKNGDDVAEALKLGASDDPQVLLRGEIAYAAIAALQDPAYVANVRAYSENEAGRRQLAGLIEQDPRYVLGLAGADTAAGLAIAALMEQGRKLSAGGAAVTQAAYDVQHQAWSKEFVPNRDQRLAEAKSANASTFTGRADEIAHLQRAAAGFDPLPLNAPAATAPYPPVVIRGLAVAALALLGEAGDENVTLVQPLLTDPTSANCLNMAKLNLYQCLAVAKPYYEDIFCLGQHAMSDTGECVMIDAGAPVPPAPSTLLPPAPPEPAAPARPASKRRRAS